MSVPTSQPPTVDLGAIMNDLGWWICENFAGGGGSLFYAEWSNYDTSLHPELEPYKEHEVVLTARGDAAFAPFDPSQVTPGPPIPYHECFNNGTDVEQSSTFNWTHETSRSFTWSLTETLSVGWKSSTEVGVPGVAKETVDWTVNFSFASTQSHTDTETQTWNISQPLVVPAQSAVKMSAVINQESYDVPFTIPINMTGCLAVMTTNNFMDYPNVTSIPGAWTITIGNSVAKLVAFIPMGSLVQYVSTQQSVPLTYVQQDTAAYMLSGVFKGAQGMNYNVNAQQLPEGGCADEDIAVTELG